jgi:flagellar hook-basal body complex protein FliE
MNALDNVNALQNNASSAATQFALGQSSDIHSVMIAGQKAGITLELTTQVRNKIVDAYQSIMQMSM